MRTSFGCEVNRHTTRYTIPVSVVMQYNWCLPEGYGNVNQCRSVGSRCSAWTSLENGIVLVAFVSVCVSL